MKENLGAYCIVASTADSHISIGIDATLNDIVRVAEIFNYFRIILVRINQIDPFFDVLSNGRSACFPNRPKNGSGG